jgi:hypothetical protein
MFAAAPPKNASTAENPSRTVIIGDSTVSEYPAPQSANDILPLKLKLIAT